MIAPIFSPPVVIIGESTTKTTVLSGTIPVAGIHGVVTLFVSGATVDSVLTIELSLTVSGTTYTRAIEWNVDAANTPIPFPAIPMRLGTAVSVSIQSDTEDAINVLATLDDVSGLQSTVRSQAIDPSRLDVAVSTRSTFDASNDEVTTDAASRIDSRATGFATPDDVQVPSQENNTLDDIPPH